MPGNLVVELWQVAPNTHRVTLGDDIRQARERAQWTQVELGKLVGVSEGTIGNWENGRVQAPKNRLARVWEVLRDYREPRPAPTVQAAEDSFDVHTMIASLNDAELAELLAAVPDMAIVADLARRLARHEGPVRSIGSRTWKTSDAPPIGGSDDPEGERNLKS